MSEVLARTDQIYKPSISKEVQLEKLLDMRSDDKVLGDVDAFETEDVELKEVEEGIYVGAAGSFGYSEYLVLSWCALGVPFVFLHMAVDLVCLLV